MVSVRVAPGRRRPRGPPWPTAEKIRTPGPIAWSEWGTSGKRVGGRPKERAEGRLRHLERDETRRFHLEIGVLASLAEIETFVRTFPR